MSSISLGPLAIPIYSALTLLAIAVFGLMTFLFTRGTENQSKAVDRVFSAAIAGFVVARLAFVVKLWSVYRENWLDIVDIRDGGFINYYGWAAAIVLLTVLCRKQRKLMVAYGKSAAVTALIILPLMLAVTLLNQGVKLPEVQLVDRQGNRVELSSFVGKPVVVNLWATWCPPCRREMPVLAKAQQEHPQVTFLFVNQRETVDEVQQFLSSQNIVLENLYYDLSGQVGRELGASGLPTTLFFHADGSVATVHMGGLSHASLAYYLDKLTAR